MRHTLLITAHTCCNGKSLPWHHRRRSRLGKPSQMTALSNPNGDEAAPVAALSPQFARTCLPWWNHERPLLISRSLRASYKCVIGVFRVTRSDMTPRLYVFLSLRVDPYPYIYGTITVSGRVLAPDGVRLSTSTMLTTQLVIFPC